MVVVSVVVSSVVTEVVVVSEDVVSGSVLSVVCVFEVAADCETEVVAVVVADVVVVVETGCVVSFEKILKDSSFKEHYSVIVGVYDHQDKRTIHNYLVAIDLEFEEVTVMRNIDERTQFYRSLGPDYDHVYSWKIEKTQELLTKE